MSPQRVLGSRWQRSGDFWVRVYQKSGEDNIFFMASAIAFNLTMAVLPLLLLVIGLWGFLLRVRYGDAAAVIVPLLEDFIPDTAGASFDFAAEVRVAINSLVSSAATFSVVGALLFVWLATRLVGTLRIALREVFDIARDRGILGGKLFDIQMIVVGGILILLNVGFTLLLQSLGEWWSQVLGLQPGSILSGAEAVVGYLAAFGSVWLLFVLIYTYIPARRIPIRTAAIAGTVMAVVFEAMKLGFGWYATEVAVFSSTYGNLTTLAVLFLWIYYGSLVFILSGEIAQVYTMRKARSVQLQASRGGVI